MCGRLDSEYVCYGFIHKFLGLHDCREWCHRVINEVIEFVYQKVMDIWEIGNNVNHNEDLTHLI